jgi:hypothetical protein
LDETGYRWAKYSLASLTDAEVGFLTRLIAFAEKDNGIPHIDRLTKLLYRSPRQLNRLLGLMTERLIAMYEGSY